MKTFNTVKTIISYVFTLFAGCYAWCLANGEIDFFMILGCVCCVSLAVIASPLFGRFIRFAGKGK